MADFLLEIFSEEIPARMQEQAQDDLANLFTAAMQQKGFILDSLKLETFATPRRLALFVPGIATQQPDRSEEKKGPKTSAPQTAIDGFIKSSGVPLEKLERRLVGKDEVFYAVIEQKGQPTAVLLKDIVETLLQAFTWPKSMRWGSKKQRWVRPIHSLLCLFDNIVVPVEFAGIRASNVTYGHRFLAPDPIVVHNSNDYEKLLKKAYVWADGREFIINDQLVEAAKKHNLFVRKDEALLKEVTGLVEWPVVLVGRIDATFMDLPAEVLISEMRAHQKYFALQDADGNLAPYFLITANQETQDGGKAIVAGNERVLRARLADGRFFYDQDRKIPLDVWGRKLAQVTFHARIGSMEQKVARIIELATRIQPYVPQASMHDITRAAQLCKADLVTGMVGEFPELQGIMGRYYALHTKENSAVADAIRDHYLPLGPDSPIPTAPVSICVALADKLDTLVSLFAAGEKPTGSKDPFALRRAALGVIRIILGNNLRIPLASLLDPELLAFFAERLKVMLRERKIRHDIVSAVLATKDDDLARITMRAEALQEFLITDAGTQLLAAYRRASNLIETEEKKSGKPLATTPIVSSSLNEPAEQQLAAALSALTPQIAACLQKEGFQEAMAVLANLRESVDQFFAQVLVNCEDPMLRQARLNLLAHIRALMHQIADFHHIEG